MELHQLGWSAFFSQQCSAPGGARGETQIDTGTMPGRVAFATRGYARLLTTEGVAESRRGPKLDGSAVTGDWVLYDPAAGCYTAILERRTWIARKRAGREAAAQILAANVDTLFLVTAFDDDFEPRRIERYLLAAAEGGAEPVVVLNKADVSRSECVIEQARAVARGAPVLVVSAQTGEGIDRLAAFLTPGHTAALAGSSGVGKSTLTNRLLDDPRQRTAVIRESDSKGRHTTTSRELFVLPGGGLLIDTPGLREFAPWADAAVVGAVFDEIGSLAGECRFRDCSHAGEPGCAVRAAVAAGAIPEDRLESFHRLRRELDWLAREQDPLEARRHKSLIKAIHKSMRKR
jgi:ribosome biogenesis GTPase